MLADMAGQDLGAWLLDRALPTAGLFLIAFGIGEAVGIHSWDGAITLGILGIAAFIPAFVRNKGHFTLGRVPVPTRGELNYLIALGFVITSLGIAGIIWGLKAKD